MATKVALRKKPISGNRQTLYLDFYPPIADPKTGKQTRREFLGMYLMDKPKNALDKQANKETLQLAEQIRVKRENRVNKPEIYEGYELEQLKKKELGEQDFLEYFKRLGQKQNFPTSESWNTACVYLTNCTNGHLKFAELNEKLCEKFKDYLRTARSLRSKKITLSQNSAATYFGRFKTALRQAYKDGYLQTDLCAKVETIRMIETHRNYLTIEELNALIKTDCINPLYKKAAIFSALTGLRFSDIQKLVWSEVNNSENGCYIQFTQKKTKGAEVLPISKQAYELLGERKDATDNVFDGLTYSAYENKFLYQWLGAAGLTRRITFHCFRHTFATLQLSKGTDVYTVSKLLGHRDIQTTQIYAKVIDKTKREAVDRIVLDF